jgi:hypothetical protein
MACIPLSDSLGKTVGFVCRGPDPEPTKQVKVRFCFGCRRHLKHRRHVIPSSGWYDPMDLWVCSTCGHDRTTFGDGKW